MSGLSEFTFVGRIVEVTDLDKVTKIRAIANYRRKGEDGSWGEDPHAVDLTVFGDGRRSYARDHLAKGDLIQAQGRIKRERYEKGGEAVFETSLIVRELSRLVRPRSDEDDDHI